MRHAKFDMGDVSDFSGQTFWVEIRDAKNERLFGKAMKADEFGGLRGELALKENAALGTYRMLFRQGHEKGPHVGNGTFRVEEYKKPEFEVTVEAPSEPVMLGETVIAKVKAKYYFGAPVTHAKVKVKVLRHNHSANWYPSASWDWLYSGGYWWFGYDYSWYPGWRAWGCPRPIWSWWHRPTPPPELVLENELEIGPDGTVEIPIDTALAKAMHGDLDHRYEITAEVRDQSRRTIVGTGKVLVARAPFKVYAWTHRGHYRVGDTIRASFQARRLDGKGVSGKGRLKLLKVTYADGKPVETEVQAWDLSPDAGGMAEQQLKASRPGQYRLSYTVEDDRNHTIEGGYVFVVRGEGYDGGDYRFHHIELVPDKKEYRPGEGIELMINTDRVGSTVLLFVRPTNGVYLPPRTLRLRGKSAVVTLKVTKKDMPNFFVEAITIADGKLHSDVRQIVVPPEKRVLSVEVAPSKDRFKPGEKGRARIRLTDAQGNPFAGSIVVTVYDKSVEYISGGSNIGDIRPFFWKWKRNHRENTLSTLGRMFYNLLKQKETRMGNLGVFGHLVADGGMVGDKSDGMAFGSEGGEGGHGRGGVRKMARMSKSKGMALGGAMMDGAAPAPRMMAMSAVAEGMGAGAGAPGNAPGESGAPAVVVRKNFADTALWISSLETDANGVAEIDLPMPENLTTWKIKVWALGHGTKVGQGSAEVITSKDLILRMQAPRFFVQTDEVVLSANIHNYLKTEQKVVASIELDGPCLKSMGRVKRTVTVKPNGEVRVDWRVKALAEGEAVVRMKAVADGDADAMEMRFPVFVHGMDKMDSYCGVIRPDRNKGEIRFAVPDERRPETARLEVRYSPTLAMAMIDAVPYLAAYPHGCTEQTLNRFLPAVLTQRTLQRLGVSLKQIKEKRANLNAQEIGDTGKRAKQWKRYDTEAVWDEAELAKMVKDGVEGLTSMQCSDGGWGWFSGYGERSYPHTTAVVVHGLQTAVRNDVAVVPGVVERGIAWLKRYEAEQVRMLKNAEKDPKVKPWKSRAGHLDAMVYMVLADNDHLNPAMRDYLYRDRNHLSLYAKGMFALGLHQQKQIEKRDMLIRNMRQYLKTDDENQTAWLEMDNGSYWWNWFGDEIETHAMFLRLLAATEPKGDTAHRLVKYLLNNRKHATYWKNTRDTASCLEAFADYIQASGEDKPDQTIELWLDGKRVKEVTVNAATLFTFDNVFVLEGEALKGGKHKLELRKKGSGPLYYNAYVSYFTLEDFIPKTGLEVKIERRVYRLKAVDKEIDVAGSRNQALKQKVEKYERVLVENKDSVNSGDLIEIELVVESKNDYEYILLEDLKAAGFEPVAVRSGYNGNALGAYVEFRDEKVCFFVRRLMRGKHSVSYRLRAETPGRFSALPATIAAMYAPELRGNSDEIKLRVKDVK
ncbi:MAG: hypothetical protein KAI66_00250 [Lentisphaeria bacterium]|nr:hypothetical protein [Lentisphaeria bacterium]